MKKRVALMAGGYSGEYEVSMKSASTIAGNLDSNLFEVYLVEVKEDAWTVIEGESRYSVDLDDFSFTKGDILTPFDYAYVIIHGSPGEDGLLHGYLEMKGIPYSTGAMLNMAMTFNKAITQRLAKSVGIPVAQHVIFTASNRPDTIEVISKIGLPCFVKPTESGSSLGVSKVRELESLDAAVDHAFEIGDEVMVEAYLDGIELACGVIRTTDGVIALPVTEVIAEAEFFDYQAKYEDSSTQEITPARISDEATLRCQELAKQIYLATGCDGIARADFFLCGEELFLVEINSIPGMSAESILPKQLEAAGLDLKDLLTWKITSDLNNKN